MHNDLPPPAAADDLGHELAVSLLLLLGLLATTLSIVGAVLGTLWLLR